MPLKRSQNRQKNAEQEGCLLLAIQAIQNGQISSLRDAACQFQVLNSTLQDRLAGCRNRAETRPNNHKLTQIEKQSLVKWVVSMDMRRAAP